MLGPVCTGAAIAKVVHGGVAVGMLQKTVSKSKQPRNKKGKNTPKKKVSLFTIESLPCF